MNEQPDSYDRNRTRSRGRSRPFHGRRLLAYGILLIWGMSLGWHVRREYFKPVAMRLAEGARSLNPGTFFYTVRMNGQAIGWAQSRLDTIADGFVFDDRVILDVPALNEFHRAIAQTRIEMTQSLGLRKFNFQLGSEIGEFAVQGTVSADSMLELELKTGGKVQRSRMRMQPGMLLDAAIPIRLAAGGELEVGRSLRTLVFNPSVMSEQEVDMAVTGRDTLIVPDSAKYDAARKRWVPSRYDTIPVWRVEQTFGGVTVASWVDEDGHLVKAESAVGYTMERTAFDLADQDWKAAQQDGSLAAGYGAVIERTAIASNVDLSGVASADQLRVRLSGVELKGFDLSGGRQSLQGDTLTIRRESAAAMSANYQLPFRGGNAELMKELESTALIQADDPRIVAQAREIAAGSRDPAVVMQRLQEWVYRRLEKDVTLSVPSAVQVLEAMQGDCNEHTVLYVALARALGLPTRTAAGLVHVRGSFYYHAWPEVWTGRAWVAVDPTLGQYPADASHLRFIVGGLARQVELIRLIGRLQLDVI